MVRGAVRVLEEGMLEQFDDQSQKPISASFTAPFAPNEDIETLSKLNTNQQESDSPISIALDSPQRNVTFSIPPTPSLDAPLPISTDDHLPIVENISYNAIDEMVNEVFARAGVDVDYLTFEDFEYVVEQDANVLAW
jgi:NAD-specific glutamate dehydrogenase